MTALSTSKIRPCAIKLLSYREHSKFELQNKLSKKGFVKNEIELLLKELADKGLQSDERFIESYINMRQNHGFGPLRIKGELYERGLEKKNSCAFFT